MKKMTKKEYEYEKEQLKMSLFWDRVFEIWEEQRKMSDEEAEDLAQAIGYL